MFFKRFGHKKLAFVFLNACRGIFKSHCRLAADKKKILRERSEIRRLPQRFSEIFAPFLPGAFKDFPDFFLRNVMQIFSCILVQQ